MPRRTRGSLGSGGDGPYVFEALWLHTHPRSGRGSGEFAALLHAVRAGGLLMLGVWRAQWMGCCRSVLGPQQTPRKARAAGPRPRRPPDRLTGSPTGRASDRFAGRLRGWPQSWSFLSSLRPRHHLPDRPIGRPVDRAFVWWTGWPAHSHRTVWLRVVEDDRRQLSAWLWGMNVSLWCFAKLRGASQSLAEPRGASRSLSKHGGAWPSLASWCLAAPRGTLRRVAKSRGASRRLHGSMEPWGASAETCGAWRSLAELGGAWRNLAKLLSIRRQCYTASLACAPPAPPCRSTCFAARP